MVSRKYRQQGYQDEPSRPSAERRPRGRKKGEGPRSPLMPGFHKVIRCSLCGHRLPQSLSDIETSTTCPKCEACLHSCKNCVYFDPASRFECTRPINQRTSRKDEGNQCEEFEIRTTVEKVVTGAVANPQDARDAFENLFKK